jgi:hypothetical protein
VLLRSSLQGPARASRRLIAALGWSLRAISPWCIAGGVLVSVAASAAYGPDTRDLHPIPLVPMVFDPDAYDAAAADPFPWAQDDRFGLTPALATPASQRFHLAAVDAGAVLGVRDPAVLPPQRLTRAPRPAAGFQPQARPDGATGPTSGGDLAAILRSQPDGATPREGRAVELATLTPEPLEPEVLPMPAVAVLLPRAPDEPALALEAEPGPTVEDDASPRTPDQPDYAGLIQPRRMKRELRCLAEAIYFEARSESQAGQAAVAQVVLNRVRSRLYPNTICGVVYQNRHRHLACQFTFACEGKSLRITEPGPWRTARRIAEEVLEGENYNVEVGGSTHYHATYVRPRWSRKLKRMDRIGTHVFYKLRPGQR